MNSNSFLERAVSMLLGVFVLVAVFVISVGAFEYMQERQALFQVQCMNGLDRFDDRGTEVRTTRSGLKYRSKTTGEVVYVNGNCMAARYPATTPPPPTR